MNIVERFGRLSGLTVVPTKSKIIFLNTAVTTTEFCGIPVLQHGDTVQYLGYAVGTGHLTDANWAARIRNVQRRLATATQLATSVETRVLLLNVIMLPAVLFTAAVFETPSWAAQQLCNLQKQFLWNHSTSTEVSRHKINPALLHAPKRAGGVGLASIRIACKTQRMKHAIIWLTQRKDIYFSAWQAWVFRGSATEWTAGVSPCRESARRPKSPGDSLRQLLGPLLSPSLLARVGEQQQYIRALTSLTSEAISWTTPEKWVVEPSRPLMPLPPVMTLEDAAFWPTYSWADNPWISDQQGNVLQARKYDKIWPCAHRGSPSAEDWGPNVLVRHSDVRGGDTSTGQAVTLGHSEFSQRFGYRHRGTTLSPAEPRATPPTASHSCIYVGVYRDGPHPGGWNTY